MMRILTRYVLREVTSHAFIGVAVFTFVVFMRDVGRILELIVRNSAPLPSVLDIFAFTLPTALTLTIPMGVLVGILIGLSRMAADSEVTAMRSAGMGAWSFVRMTSLFVLLGWLLALFNNLYVAPRSAAALSALEDKLKATQASFEVQPRVFYEGFPNYVLYLQDSETGAGAALWKGVFLADISTPGEPKITVARNGVVVANSSESVQLHLAHGSQHETIPKQPDQYSVSTFAQTDIPMQLPSTAQQSKDQLPVTELSTRDLFSLARDTTDAYRARGYMIEFHRRIALPTACLVLALVGIPLGLSSKKGGKSTGFVLTIALVFLYYFISLSGMSLARQGKIPPGIGLWLGNFAFLAGGLVLLWRVDRMPIQIPSAKLMFSNLKERLIPGPTAPRENGEIRFGRSSRRKRFKGARFPQILDELILRDFMLYLGLVLGAFLVLMLVFTFFELLGDIVRNHVPLLLVGDYLLNLTPFLLYNMAPLSVLLAVLITFGLMEKSNEITAMKATGISIYRIIVPITVIAAMLSMSLFFFDQFYLPHANKRQDALRNQIKGKPAQTYLRPDRKWIFGQQNTIFYYQFYDPDQNRFGSISAFEFDPHTFELTKRIYAARAHWGENLNKWVFEDGWERSFRGPVTTGYRRFDVNTFPEISETPGYFKKEVKQSSEMNYGELRHYIGDLEHSGFDVVRLRVQLQKKFAFPIITFVMAVLAIPFSLSTGRRGALAGVATAIGIAMVYWVASALFEGLGNTSQLPAAMAAWSPDLLFALAGGYLILKVPT
jgi:LPS export ABC transporter permease LptF/LPS export ABC transporter permease LptG